jgi:hypothetical protein
VSLRKRLRDKKGKWPQTWRYGNRLRFNPLPQKCPHTMTLFATLYRVLQKKRLRDRKRK